MATETYPDVARHAESANEAIRAMGATARFDLPLGMAYDVIQDLRGVAIGLPKVFELIADAIWHDVGAEANPKMSRVDLREAMQQLNVATGIVAELDDTLRAAQNLIAVPAHRDVNPAET